MALFLPFLCSAALVIGLIHNSPVSQTMRLLVLYCQHLPINSTERYMITEIDAPLSAAHNVFVPRKPQSITSMGFGFN